MGSTHLSDEQLARYQDGDLGAGEAGHLESCAACSGRLRDMETARALYAEYRDVIRQPSLPPAPRPWADLSTLVERHQAGRARTLRRWLVPSLAAAVFAMVAVTVVLRNAGQPSRRATELLERAAAVELPEGRLIAVAAHGRSLLRPAVLLTGDAAGSGPEMAHWQAVFTAAEYSWREPLSPRSFQAWRTRQSARRDSVTVVGEAGANQAYRVRTESPAGALASASLTLRMRDLHPIGGSFDFKGEGTVELSETAAPAGEAPRPPAPAAATAPPPETPAGPADALRVLAALDGIGADVGEPISLSEDPQHRRVMVHAGALSRERQREVAAVLQPLPRVALDFDNGAPPGRVGTQPGAAEPSSANIPAGLRQEWEARLGGAVRLQEITDRVLESSASVLARAHAMEVLGGWFPPEVEARLTADDRELLGRLHRRHVAELARLAAVIRADLKPLLAPSVPPQTTDNEVGRSWQAGVPSLLGSARDTDTLLNRLLAGSYSQSDGENMWRGLTAQIERLEQAIQAQQREGR